MSLTIVDHQTEGKCLLDTETFEYYLLPDLNNKIIFNGKLFNYHETINDFIHGDEDKAVIPLFCTDVKKNNRRFYATVLTGKDTLNIYNVERINNKWVRNEIESVEKLNAYFMFCKKNEMADNGFVVLRTRRIEKNAI